MSAEQKLLDMIRVFLPEVPSTIHDIKNPTGSFACQVYAAILNELGVSNSLKNTQGSQLQIITYSDMFADIIPYLNVCQGVNYFMKSIGVDDFGLCDLLAPEPKRNLFLMGKLLQFISHADKMIGRLQTENLIDLKIKRDKLLIRIEELQTYINHRVTERARNNNLMKTQEKSVEDMKKRLKELTEKKEILQKKVEDVQQLSLQYEEALNKNHFMEAKFNEEIATLEAMDEEIPDNIVIKIDQLVNYREELKKNVDDIINQTSEKKSMTAFVSRQTECFEKQHKELQCLCDLQRIICEAELETNFCSERLKQLINQHTELVREEKVTFSDVSNHRKTIEEFSAYEKQTAAQQEGKLKELNKEYEQMKINLLQMNADTKKYEEDLRKLRLRKSELDKRLTELNETVQQASHKITMAETHSDTCIQMVNKYVKRISEMEERAGIKFCTNMDAL